jgi:hypothetical protein
MVPYSLAIQKASGVGWLISKLTGDAVFEVILAHSMHELRASSDERMAV